VYRPTRFDVYASRRQGVRRWLLALAVLLALGLGLAACGGTSSAPSTSGGASGQAVTVPVKVIQGPMGATEVLLPVTINGRGPFTFLLDTGASTSVIDTPIAQRLGLPQTGGPVPISGVASQTTEVPVGIKSWHIGKINLPSMSVGSLALYGSQRGQGLQGLIGSDIWDRFGSITINYGSQTLTVPKQITSAGRTPNSTLRRASRSLAVRTPAWIRGMAAA
jgi:hypothetical protein